MAVEALGRIENEGAYANLVLGGVLARSGLDARDRRFVTELVYGTTRMRRACDYLVDRFVTREVDTEVRTVLRLGAYQLHFGGVAPHAAVAATVSTSPPRARGFVNAILRRVAEAPVTWPDDATRLSYPDWIVARLVEDLGAEDALAALEAMNEPATVVERADGYVQDTASQWVTEAVDARPGHRVADLCAAPGGKATGLAAAGATVLAVDLRPGRVDLIAETAAGLDIGPDRLAAVVGDGRLPPLRPGSFDRVLVDAPCSGLGSLRRRADARWRIEPEAVDRLAVLQEDLVAAAVALLRPGGVLVYSVCTLTRAETVAVDERLASRFATLVPVEAPGDPWQPWGRGAILLPQQSGTDGMALFRLRAP